MGCAGHGRVWPCTGITTAWADHGLVCAGLVMVRTGHGPGWAWAGPALGLALSGMGFPWSGLAVNWPVHVFCCPYAGLDWTRSALAMVWALHRLV